MTMTFKTSHASYPNCHFVTGYYPNGNLALQVANPTLGHICTCTVNPGCTVPHDALAIKNYSENQGMVTTLTNMGIIGPELYRIPSGWTQIHVHQLTEKGHALFVQTNLVHQTYQVSTNFLPVIQINKGGL